MKKLLKTLSIATIIAIIALTLPNSASIANAQNISQEDLKTVALTPKISAKINGFKFNTIRTVVDITRGKTASIEIIAPAIIAKNIVTSKDGNTFVIKHKKSQNGLSRKEQKKLNNIQNKYNNNKTPLIQINITIPTVELIALNGWGSKLNFHSTFNADKLHLKSSSGRITNAKFNINGGDVTISGGYASRINAEINGAENLYLSTGSSGSLTIITANISDVELEAGYASSVELQTGNANNITIDAGSSSNIKCQHLNVGDVEINAGYASVINIQTTKSKDIEINASSSTNITCTNQNVGNVEIDAGYSSRVNFNALNGSDIFINAGSSSSVTNVLKNIESLTIDTGYSSHVNSNVIKVNDIKITAGSSSVTICKFESAEKTTVKGGYNSKVTLDGKSIVLESSGANLTIKNNNTTK